MLRYGHRSATLEASTEEGNEDRVRVVIATIAAAAPPAADVGILLTGLVLGIRHGIDWDHIAAITDITSTTASAGMAEAAHAGQHVDMGGHQHAPRRTASRSAPTTPDPAARRPHRRSRRGRVSVRSGS